MKKQQKPRIRTDTRRRITQRTRKEHMNIGTWNVLSLYRPGAAIKAIKEMERMNMDITALQEIRWPGVGHTDVGNSVLFYSGNDQNAHAFGTGFVLKKSLLNSVLRFEPLGDRMCYIRIKGTFYNYSLLSVHAPTEDKDEGIKDLFYDTLERKLAQLPKQDMTLILGDFNAKIGQEEALRPHVGMDSLRNASNDNGLRVADLAASNNMLIKSTMFEHKDIHKMTWVSNDGVTRNQIDHVIIDARHGRNVLDVRSCRGADADSDHFLVKAKIRVRISTAKNKRTNRLSPQWDTEKLQQTEIRAQYQEELERRIREITNTTYNTDMDAHWKFISGTITEAARKVVGEKPRRQHKNHWYDEDCEEAMEKRNTARLKMLKSPTDENRERFRRLRTLGKKLLRRKKREWQDRELIALEEEGKNNTRTFYQKLRSTKAGFRPRTDNILKKENGDLITDKVEILQTWKNYFHQLLDGGTGEEEEALDLLATEQPNEIPSKEEIAKAIKKLKNNKAPGGDLITAELLKYGGDTIITQLQNLIKTIWEKEAIPDDWKESIMIPIHKKGDRTVCKNYRGIALINVAYKVLSNVILLRLTSFTEKILGDYQCGFRANRSTTDQLFTIRQLLEKSWEFNQDLHQLFIDFQQAYDSVKRVKIWHTMAEFGIPPKLIRVTRACVEGSRCRVKIGDDLSDVFQVSTGLKQGDALSPTLFNIALEKVVREAKIETQLFGASGSNLLLAYADDIDAVSISVIKVKELFYKIEKEAAYMGLKVNEAKTKYMHVSRPGRARIGQNVTMDTYNFENVKQFKYLGSTITSDNDMSEEIRERLKSANRCLYALKDILESKYVTRRTKIKTYQTMIRPVVMYGCETWTLTVRNEELIRRFERKVLRKIFGPTKNQDTRSYRIKTNAELKQIYNQPELINLIKAQRLRWAGHVRRQPEDRMVRLIWDRAPEGRRPLGRPRLRWRDNITSDLRKMGIGNGLEVMEDRDRWRQIVASAKAHQGL